jgi:glucose-6-phosphate dehydrogenase assembly protein OpcA
MATAYKVLGQVAPSATTATTVYTVPAATSAVVSSIAVCNRAGTAATFRLSVRPDGASLANQHYLTYDAALDANDTIILTIGVTMDATDVLEAYASSGDLTFQAYGSEIS